MYPFIYFCQFVYEKDAHSPFFAKVELSIFASESRDLAVCCPAFSVPCWGGGRVQGALSISQMCRVIREREVWTKGWIRKWEDKLWTRSQARELVSGITKLEEWEIREIKKILKPWGSHLPPSVFPLLLPLFLLNFISSSLLLDMFFGLILKAFVFPNCLQWTYHFIHPVTLNLCSENQSSLLSWKLSCPLVPS